MRATNHTITRTTSRLYNTTTLSSSQTHYHQLHIPQQDHYISSPCTIPDNPSERTRITLTERTCASKHSPAKHPHTSDKQLLKPDISDSVLAQILVKASYATLCHDNHQKVFRDPVPAFSRVKFPRSNTPFRTTNLKSFPALRRNMSSTNHGPANSVSTQTVSNYAFPTHRLKQRQSNPDRTPLVLVACGSFSPITYLHLRMFEMGIDFAKFSTEFEVVGGYLSPVSSLYKKAGLAPAHHRLRMCELAVDQTSNWLMVDPWEAVQAQYMPTAQVLDHFDHEINTVMGGIEVEPGVRRKVRIILLAGADLIQTMSTPGVWSEKDLDHILGRYGAFIVERSGTDIEQALQGLQNWRDSMWIIQQLIQNDVSSTKIRLFLRREMSVQYLIPAPVIEYIEANDLYEEEGASEKKKNSVKPS